MTETYVIAAFRTDMERSVLYRRLKTPKALTCAVGQAIAGKGADYISIRIIRGEG